MYVANLIAHERVLGIISRMCSHPAGPDLQPKSWANWMREAMAEFNFRSTLSKSRWLLAKSVCVFVHECSLRLRKDGKYSVPWMCGGGGTYLNISEAGECDSSRWTQSPHTDIVVIHWSLLLKFSTARMLLGVWLSLLHMFFFFFFFTICLSMWRFYTGKSAWGQLAGI